MVTYGMAALILAGILLAVGAMTKKSSSRKQMFTVAFVIGAVGLLPVVMPGTIPFLEGEIGFGGTAAITTVQQTPSGICAVEDTTVTLSAVDKYTASATGGTHRYRVNGAPALTVSDAGTFTASPGDSVEILWMNSTQGNSYIGKVDKVTVPCAGTKTFSTDLYQNKTLTFEVFNEEGNLVVDDTENETISAGDVVTLRMVLKGTHQGGFPYGGLIVVEYNSTAYDDVSLLAFGGSEVEVPFSHTLLGTAYKAKAYSIPPILSNKILDESIVIEADDTVDPTATGGDINMTWFTYDYYVNNDNGGSFDGPDAENQNGAVTHGYQVSYIIPAD